MIGNITIIPKNDEIFSRMTYHDEHKSIMHEYCNSKSIAPKVYSVVEDNGILIMSKQNYFELYTPKVITSEQSEMLYKILYTLSNRNILFCKIVVCTLENNKIVDSVRIDEEASIVDIENFLSNNLVINNINYKYVDEEKKGKGDINVR